VFQNRLLSTSQSSVLRVAVGVVLGLVIALLIDNDDRASTWGTITASVLGLSAFVVWAGAGAMRSRSLLIWVLVAAALLTLIHWHEQRVFPERDQFLGTATSFLTLLMLFIAHELVSSADQAKRPIAPFSIYFDEAWKRGTQLALSILFTALFWAILMLGALLLNMIGFEWLENILQEDVVYLPLTGVAFAVSVSLCDHQGKLIDGVRTLVLGVLSWLLPVLTLIGGVFAVSLLFSGLKPLWDTNAGTASLLSGCVAFVLLINATYQQGEEEREIHIVQKWSVRIASVLLLTFAVLAAWGLGLRIGQYGLSPERVVGVVAILVSVLFGVGYTAAAILPGRWMALLERVNIAMAVLKVGLLFALVSPIAPPARLSVENHMARVAAGKLNADTIDWRMLESTGQFGTDALNALTSNPDSAIAENAKLTLSGTIPGTERAQGALSAVNELVDVSKLRVVFPQGGSLPSVFMETKGVASFAGEPINCLLTKGSEQDCAAAVVDINNDNLTDVVLLTSNRMLLWTNGAGQGEWRSLIYSPSNAARAAFLRGEIEIGRPLNDDLLVGDRRISGAEGYRPETMRDGSALP
jgi:hypothetical protein